MLTDSRMQAAVAIVALAVMTVGNGCTEPAENAPSPANTQSATKTASADSGTTVQSRIGTLEFTHDFANGYPTRKTVTKLIDEMDFQRATQVYLWSLPIVSFAQWQWSHENMLGAPSGDIVYYDDYLSKIGILTANATTPYAISFINLLKTGPIVVDLPKGEVRGMVTDMWQITTSGLAEPGKYLFYPPGTKAPSAPGHKVMEAGTNNIFFGIRLMSTDGKKRLATLDRVKIYPYANRANPRPTKVVRVTGRKLARISVHPRGLAYFERLAAIMKDEVIGERDRFFHSMMKPLGIEKGKSFSPDARQKKILTEAALVGEAMAKANDFYNPRLEASHYHEGSHWEVATVSPPNQRWKNYDALDGRAAWFYEALTNTPGMQSKKPGWGQIYLAGYMDGDGGWLDGAKNYKLHVPANVPAGAFWSTTVYDIDTRCLIDNEQQIADRSSRMDLLKNADGSVDIYYGPEAPKGKEQNWVPTVPGRSWFTYFRFYSPLEPYFDRSWVLPDIEKASW